MLAFLAAVAPLVASLYVVASVLAEHSRATHTARVVARVEGLLAARRDALDISELGGAEYDRRKAVVNGQREMLLRANGVDPTFGTHTAVRRLIMPRPVSAIEIRRQWALLVGAAAGVVLLALDAIRTL